MLHHLRARLSLHSISAFRNTRRSLATWAEHASNPKHRIQIYKSQTTDPFLNLAVEQFLLERTPSGSCILFQYVNRPCIVIGRNQNPWLEVNLRLLQAAASRRQAGTTSGEPPETEPQGLGRVDLVRRRSGGGAVFHDEGNVNWSIICPSSIFTRDKHAEMIVRALRNKGIERARVNERHDIVLDQGHERHEPADPTSLHHTPYTIEPDSDGTVSPKPLKVSGSAYKLTRGRALHHGTCLLASPNLQIIPHYLHSPARGHIKAKGVESVSSPVANIGLDTVIFRDAVRKGFEGMYAQEDGVDVSVSIGERALEVPRVKEMWDEMQTLEWTYGQTPQFTFSTQPIEGSTRKATQEYKPYPMPSNMLLDFKHGQLLEANVVSSDTEGSRSSVQGQTDLQALQGRKLYDPSWNWNDIIQHLQAGDNDMQSFRDRAKWLQQMLPGSHQV